MRRSDRLSGDLPVSGPPASLNAPPRRRLLGVLAIFLAAAALVGLTWSGVTMAVRAERSEAQAGAETDVANQALAFETQLQLQLLAVDQTLRMLQHEWEADPSGFDLQSWQRRAVVLGDVSLRLFIAGSDGVVRQSGMPEMLGVDVGAREYFQHEATMPADDGRMFIARAARGLVTNRWNVVLVRRLSTQDGGFAGIAAVSYGPDALARLFAAADLGRDGLIEVVGLTDGQVRAAAGPADAAPGQDVAGTPMFAAARAHPDGRWSGPSPDGVERLHAFRQLPDRDMVLVVGRDRADALHGSRAWVDGAFAAAWVTTALIVAMAAALVRSILASRRRERLLSDGQASLAAANLDLRTARARADATAAGLEATLAGMSDGVVLVGPDLRLVQWNDAAIDMIGVAPPVLQAGMHMADVLRFMARAGQFGPVDPEAEVARRLAALWSPGQPRHIKFERTRPDGRVLEVRRSALPDGGFVVLFADVTLRKQAENALRDAQSMAETASEAKSRFVAIVSHEIRTPLNTLLNSLRMLGETDMRPDQTRLAGLAGQAGDALLALLNDVLEMSRMEAGRLVLRPAPFALRPLLASVTEMFRAEADRRGITLHVWVAADVPSIVTTDPGRVRQVLINLVSNAVKFSRPGAVWLRAACKGACERSGQGGELFLTVEDCGPPISEEDRSRLFQPFSQLEQRSAGGSPGSGLGLSICQRLTALLGGGIGCDATVIGGNAFWIRLPLGEGGDAPENEGTRPILRARLPRTRILLAEDVLPSQHVMAAMLRRDGHLVDAVARGDDAVRAASLGCYDIVLMDIFMPGLSGIEAARRIRALPGAAGRTPIVALTANVSDEDRAAFAAAGMCGAIGKPVEPETLARALQNYVWGARASRTLASRAADPPSALLPAVLQPPDARPPVLSKTRLASLRAHLPGRKLLGLVDGCFDEFAARMPLLRAALDSGSASAAEAEAHAMTGLAGSYGLARLDQRLREVMTAAGAGDLAAAARAAATLQSELAQAERALREALSAETV